MCLRFLRFSILSGIFEIQLIPKSLLYIYIYINYIINIYKYI